MERPQEQRKTARAGLGTLIAAFAFIGAAALAQTSCGFGEGANDDLSAQQARDFEKLAQDYRQVQGVYQGTLATGDPQFPRAPATLIVYVVDMDAGSNPDGSHRTPPVLNARFRLDQAVMDTDNVIMTGDFKKATGRLVLTSAMASGGSGGPVGGPASGQPTPPGSGGGGATSPLRPVAGTLSMGGTIRGETLENLAIVHNGGGWGTFQGVRISSDVVSPVGGQAATDRDRLFRIFGVAEGRYEGVISGQGRGVTLQLFTNLGSDDTQAAYLSGRMDYAGGVPGVGIIYLVAVNFDALTGRIFLQQNPDPGGRFSLNGWVRNGHMEVEVRSRDGLQGTLIADRRH